MTTIGLFYSLYIRVLFFKYWICLYLKGLALINQFLLIIYRIFIESFCLTYRYRSHRYSYTCLSEKLCNKFEYFSTHHPFVTNTHPKWIAVIRPFLLKIQAINIFLRLSQSYAHILEIFASAFFGSNELWFQKCFKK